ncbi:ABC transporter ATP-binding protein [Microvirga rosea]|uniref:ABC transporter ATP-binding protein n=1 Tax=Microvirga rosea TaxID=2715425 RepID=UPI001D0BB230|nr:ABC transporter ATP-binding protein [Microvirga rosea]MCB8822234.1 ABC transporter ATP-binding protein [Microvirga rosea]
MSEIVLRNITKSYGSHTAIPGLDLDIPKGSFVTLLGPSGCGKTTTLRVIAGLEQATTGEVSLGGKTVYSSRTGTFVPPERRGLGFIFQSYALWPNMKVDRNITLALSEAKQSPPVIKERLAEALAKVQLTGLADRYPSELSGGQQQRVAVARLIAARNSILLMDEPLSNLDAKLRTEMRTELKRLHRELEATTVYVTHDQVEALTMSDIIVVMKDGIIQQQGSPYEIYHDPANLFVAEFIGDPKINLLDGVLATVAGEHVIRFEGMEIPVAAGLERAEGPVTLAIRPENISIVERPGPASLPAEVDIVQPTGSQTIISLSVKGHRITALIPRFETSLPKKSIWIDFPADRLSFFDKGTGQRIPLKGPALEASHAA